MGALKNTILLRKTIQRRNKGKTKQSATVKGNKNGNSESSQKTAKKILIIGSNSPAENIGNRLAAS